MSRNLRMRRSSPLVAAVLGMLLPSIAPWTDPASLFETSPDTALAIRNVTVLPMSGTAPLERVTVVVAGDRITAVGPTAQIPSGAHVLDGTGRFLVPGFIDMHVHLSKARASAMGLLVLNGVTTVRDLGGDYEELVRWRQDVRAGRRVGPRIFLAGPILESVRNIERMRRDPPEERCEPFEKVRIGVGSPEEAPRVIADLAARPVDFVKIRTVQDEATYLALNAAADAHDLKLVGHVSGLSPELVLKAGQDAIEHPFTPAVKHPTKEARMALWRQFAARGVPIVPTLTVVEHGVFAPLDHLRAMLDDVEGKVEPRRKYLSKYLIRDWREQLLETTVERQAAFRKVVPDMLRDVREMSEAGMSVLPGSDTAAINIFPGSSLHDEIELFVTRLQMSPAAALESATRRAAAFLGMTDAGTIEPGKIADLVLLDGNPLEDIRQTRRIAAVVIGGTLYDRPELDRLLSAVAAAPDLKVDDWSRTPSP
jgi:imidazolonepropionase-like amidohydrolase